MARGPATFKQSDLTRALKGVKSAGIEVARVELDAQRKIINIIAGTPSKGEPVDELDRELEQFEARNGQG